MKSRICIWGLLASISVQAQDLDQLLEQSAPDNSVVSATFKSTRVVTQQSVETSGKGVLNMVLSHRFGALGSGFDQFFGLDMAHTRLGLDYGITDRINVGLERANDDTRKPVNAWTKLRLLQQKNQGMPLSLSWYSSYSADLAPNPGLGFEYTWKQRSSSIHELILARKFSENLSLQISPTLVQRGLYALKSDVGLLPLLGMAGRYKISHRIALSGETFVPLMSRSGTPYEINASAGLDIETGGHVFQIHLSNTTALSEDRALTEVVGSAPGLGFNLTRAFNF